MSFFWIIVFSICSLLFFGIAIVVAVKGFADLRDLLGIAVRRKR
jgi:hypothetical protein